MSNQQTQAIANANQVIALAQQLVGLYNSINQLNNSWNDDLSLTTLQNMATCAQNPDGTLGAADASPVSSHPINTNTYTTLSRPISANSLASILTQLNNINSFINGNALSATPGVRSVLDSVVGG